MFANRGNNCGGAELVRWQKDRNCEVNHISKRYCTGRAAILFSSRASLRLWICALRKPYLLEHVRKPTFVVGCLPYLLEHVRKPTFVVGCPIFPVSSQQLSVALLVGPP